MKIIAEVGANHRGFINIAKQMIDTLSDYCGVDSVKFQKRNNRELLGKDYDKPHPNPENSYGNTYGEHRDSLEFNLEQHKELKEYCENKGLIYSCSVWDLTSTKEIVSLNPVMIKIPSAQNNNFEILEYLMSNYPGEIHISLGMTTYEEIENIYQFAKMRNRNKDLVFYICTSGYPVLNDDICIREVEKLKKYDIKGFGFSGHHTNIAVDNMTVAYGFDYIERHFTINKNWKGTDHPASLEPKEMRSLVKNIKQCVSANKFKSKEILDCELKQRNKLKYK